MWLLIIDTNIIIELDIARSNIIHVCHFVPLSSSAGVGRTGTYVVLDNVLDKIEAESVVDIDGVIVKARNQRMKMVQTKVSNLSHTITTLHDVGFIIVKLKVVSKQDCFCICGMIIILEWVELMLC